jgi:hypothetical protein
MADNMLNYYADDQEGIVKAAKAIREGLDFQDLTPAINTFEQRGAESDERLKEALAQSQKDPRNIFDRLAPALLGAGAIADMVGGRTGTPSKYAAYSDRLKKAVQDKRDQARQRYIDTLTLEDKQGRRQSTVLGAKQSNVSGVNANIRSSASVATGLQAQKKADERAKVANEANDRKIRLAEQQFNKELAQEALARDILENKPQDEWDASDVATLNNVFKGASYETAAQTFQRQMDTYSKDAADLFYKTVDTEGMSPEQIMNALSAFTFRHIKTQFETFDQLQGTNYTDMFGGVSAGNTDAGPIAVAEPEKTPEERATRTRKLTIKEKRIYANKHDIPIEDVPDEITEVNPLLLMVYRIQDQYKNERTPLELQNMQPSANLQGNISGRVGPMN